MPELPDIELYLSALRPRILQRRLERLRLASPFFLRSVGIAPDEVAGRTVVDLRRLGKRIVVGLEDDLFLVLHLMIAGRLRWKAAGEKIPGKLGLAALDFDHGTLLVTEAGTRKRASLHIVTGEVALEELDPGGMELFSATLADFSGALREENHTVKRTLTDPHVFSGIGNAYSDEILHAAQLSPLKLTSRLTGEEIARLFEATLATLRHWVDELQREIGDGFPEKVTAFRDGMAVHGRFGKPCPRCQTPIQRLTYAQNEANYCPTCQTGGRLLADRALSRLLREDWPRSLEELEAHKQARRLPPSAAGAEGT